MVACQRASLGRKKFIIIVQHSNAYLKSQSLKFSTSLNFCLKEKFHSVNIPIIVIKPVASKGNFKPKNFLVAEFRVLHIGQMQVFEPIELVKRLRLGHVRSENLLV